MTDMYNVLVFYGSLAVIVSLFCGPLQWLLVEITRQKLFEIRDAIFDLAADEHISFDDPSYIEIRAGIERLIRYAHNMGLVRTLIVTRVTGFKRPKYSKTVLALNAMENRALAKQIGHLLERGDKAIFRLILLRNPLVGLIYFLGILSGLAPLSKRREVGNNLVATLQAEAEKEPELLGATV